ncbi:MarR family transcriptional regulator [Aquincola sp. MAHUQ-54]|uniref:MarR family transcriptional regulator n=1 Tax=Aquincola agrisoli TaxID=3119538 RepID=A0AAW9Q9E0_9BURK
MRVLRRFRVVFNAVRTHFQQVEKSVGLGGAQAWALSVIGQRPGIGVGELAREMDIHQSTASNLVRQLLARGLVATEPHATDRRAVQLRALPAGQRVMSRSKGPFSGVLPRALAELDEATLLRLDEDLSRLIEVLDADQRAATQTLADL